MANQNRTCNCPQTPIIVEGLLSLKIINLAAFFKVKVRVNFYEHSLSFYESF